MLSFENTHRGGKVNMFTNTYPRKLPRKINWSSTITRLTARITCGLMSNLAIYNHVEKSMILHDTEGPYSDQVYLNSTKPKTPLNTER